jgi:hypothetical protein
MPPFDVPYTEKLEVGYKWFDGENKEPLSRSLPAPVSLRSRQAGLRLYPAASLVKAWGCRIALPGCEAVESRLQQRRGRSEARHPEAVDCGCQIKQPPSGSLAQNTQDPSDPQAASGGNASRCFFVEQDDVSLYGLGQEDSRLFAGLKSLQAGAAESATGARSSGRAAAFQSGL